MNNQQAKDFRTEELVSEKILSDGKYDEPCKNLPLSVGSSSRLSDEELVAIIRKHIPNYKPSFKNTKTRKTLLDY
jgi:hypothetical protein